MGVFRQLGDPICPPCLCQHHEAAYAGFAGTDIPADIPALYDNIADGATIVQVPITIAERCCVVVNAATLVPNICPPGTIRIERPVGTDRSQQHNILISNGIALDHVAAWEVLPPGIYTYYAVNRFGALLPTLASWIKAVASDCEG